MKDQIGEIVAEMRRVAEFMRGLDGTQFHRAVEQWADKLESLGGWQDISTAPKGVYAEYTTDPQWVPPPDILLLFEDNKISVARWDWCYAEGGRLYEGCPAWIEPTSGELLPMLYNPPTHWMPLPAPPKQGESND